MTVAKFGGTKIPGAIGHRRRRSRHRARAGGPSRPAPQPHLPDGARAKPGQKTSAPANRPHAKHRPPLHGRGPRVPSAPTRTTPIPAPPYGGNGNCRNRPARCRRESAVHLRIYPCLSYIRIVLIYLDSSTAFFGYEPKFADPVENATLFGEQIRMGGIERRDEIGDERRRIRQPIRVVIGIGHDGHQIIA